MRVILIRHGESKKNIIDTIGGFGDSLTCRGRLRVERARKQVKQKTPRLKYFLFAPAFQTKQTAHSLARNIKKAFIQESSLLKPISLGCISGLSVKDAKIRYPSAMDGLARWNKGEIDISELCIPGMQDLSSFYLQGLHLLQNSRKHRSKNLCIVATRSSLILIKNIKLRRVPEAGGNYKNINFEYARPINLRLTTQDYHWIKNQIQERLQKYGTLEPTKLQHLNH